MKSPWYSLVTLALISPVAAQEPVPAPSASTTDAGSILVSDGWSGENSERRSGSFLTGDKGFPNFIGYISNPTKALDPRSLTQILPIFDFVSLSTLTHTARGVGPLPPKDVTLVPAGDIYVIGPALSVAVNDRLNVGLTSGGPALTSYPGRSSGWLDLGGYAQYTLIRDVPGQFIGTVGMTWVAPSGTSSLFQGAPPWYLGAYGTVGKEFGDWHFLTTVGFEFPVGEGAVRKDTFYGTIHIDRRFGWLYPLVEFNWAVLTANADLDTPFLPHLFSLDNFSANGSILTVAPGFNAVLIPDRLEVGAVYQTPIASQRDVHFNSVLVKLVLRY